MEKKVTLPGCAACSINRRRFLTAAGAAGVTGLVPMSGRPDGADKKMRLKVIYALKKVKQDDANWPNMGFDFAPAIESFNNTLANAFPEIEFSSGTAHGPAQAGRIIMSDIASQIDGYIVFQMDLWNVTVPTLVSSGKPVLYVDFKYGGSGEFLISSSVFLQGNIKNVGLVCSPEPDDLIAAVKCFELAKGKGGPDFAAAVTRVRKERTPGPGDLACAADPVDLASIDECLAKARESKILAVGYPGVSFFGVPEVGLKKISYRELDSAWADADREEARAAAERWRQSADKVEEVSEETLQSSAAMYLGMKQLLSKHRANAITVNCLQGFYSNNLHAYPCLGFHELNNEGQVGACECDVRSAATMVLMTALTRGRPGYISDPVLDFSKRQIIYAHCVASNRPFGPGGPANPYEILTHSEDRKGASVRSILPPGYMTTTVEFAPERGQVLMHRAKTLGNDPDDRACRTKLVAEPIGDMEKLLTTWDKWGWHRVTVYGDLQEPVRELAHALRYKVVEEA